MSLRYLCIHRSIADVFVHLAALLQVEYQTVETKIRMTFYKGKQYQTQQ